MPQEALIQTMETNQKFVPVFDADGKLTQHFIGIANVDFECLTGIALGLSVPPSVQQHLGQAFSLIEIIGVGRDEFLQLCGGERRGTAVRRRVNRVDRRSKP